MGLEGAQDAISEVNGPQGSFCRQQQCKDCQSCRLPIHAATDELLPGTHAILRTAGQQRLGLPEAALKSLALGWPISVAMTTWLLFQG